MAGEDGLPGLMGLWLSARDYCTGL